MKTKKAANKTKKTRTTKTKKLAKTRSYGKRKAA
jgi:hypothetical protein